MTAVILISCNPTADSSVFESDKLKGKYKVDLTPFIAESIKSEGDENEWEKLGKGIAAMALSSIEIELNFYDNNKGIMHLDGGLVDFAAALSNEPIEKIHNFTYKVENDSVLYMKDNEGDAYRKWAIIQKYSENYDYLKLLIIEEGKDKVYFNLSKVTE